jgi:hypothetical protein
MEKDGARGLRARAPLPHDPGVRRTAGAPCPLAAVGRRQLSAGGIVKAPPSSGDTARKCRSSKLMMRSVPYRLAITTSAAGEPELEVRVACVELRDRGVVLALQAGHGDDLSPQALDWHADLRERWPSG